MDLTHDTARSCRPSSLRKAPAGLGLVTGLLLFGASATWASTTPSREERIQRTCSTATPLANA